MYGTSKGNAFQWRQQQSAFKNCLLVKCSTLLPFLADSDLFSCLPLCLSPLSCINFSMPNQCFFISERERQSQRKREGGKNPSNTSDNCVAESLHKRAILISVLSVEMRLILTDICYWNQMITYHGMRLSNALSFMGKHSSLVPLAEKGRCFDVGVVSSQSLLGHWSHICKSCLMNNAYIKSTGL